LDALVALEGEVGEGVGAIADDLAVVDGGVGRVRGDEAYLAVGEDGIGLLPLREGAAA
jgi:hypothetical protein